MRGRVALAAFAFGLMSMESAYGQIYLPQPPEKKWTESQPLYQPYTGPGYGNKEPQSNSVGQARKQYNDAAGTSAYSTGGNSEATQLGDKPRKPKNKNTKPSSSAEDKR